MHFILFTIFFPSFVLLSSRELSPKFESFRVKKLAADGSACNLHCVSYYKWSQAYSESLGPSGVKFDLEPDDSYEVDDYFHGQQYHYIPQNGVSFLLCKK